MSDSEQVAKHTHQITFWLSVAVYWITQNSMTQTSTIVSLLLYLMGLVADCSQLGNFASGISCGSSYIVTGLKSSHMSGS